MEEQKSFFLLNSVDCGVIPLEDHELSFDEEATPS